MPILIDTCVLSELVRRAPDRAVVDWFDRFGGTSLLCSPVIMELQAGVSASKGSTHPNRLEKLIDRLLKRFPSDRRCVFDEPAAIEAAAALRMARRSGRPLGIVDAQIVGLAASLRCPIGTRDADFLDRGVDVVNPWEE